MEENFIHNTIKNAIKEIVTDKINNELKKKVEEFRDDLELRKDNYIAEVMKGIRITHEREMGGTGINYRIIFENVYKIEK